MDEAMVALAPRKPQAPSTQHMLKPQPVASEALWSWGKIRDTFPWHQVTIMVTEDT